MAYFWLQDEDANTLYLDDYVTELNIGGLSRDYKIVDYIGAPGGYVQGWGTIGSRKLKVSKKEIAQTGEGVFINDNRNDFLKWFLFPKYKDLWFYMQDSNGLILKTRAYCTQIGDEKTTFLRITENKDFEIILSDGIFQSTTQSQDSTTITSIAQTEKSIINNGTFECPIKFRFEPDNNCTYIQVMTTEGFGFRIETDMLAGSIIIFDTTDSSMTIDGVSVNSSNYITAGSVFNLPTGTSSLFINSDTSGTLRYYYYERYV